LLWCSAGCDQQQVLAALEERGVGKSDLFASRKGQGEGRSSTPSKPTAPARPCTLATYAEAKRLPVPFLQSLGLSDMHYMGAPGLRIPYMEEDGKEGAVRFRLALEKSLEGDNRFRWRKGSKPVLYGLWRIGQARQAGYAFLVEGESCCHCLWHHGFPALGVPGANSWREAVVEPDRGGETFWERLAASPIRERLYRVELEVPDDQD
jgi:hypothetical protein